MVSLEAGDVGSVERGAGAPKTVNDVALRVGPPPLWSGVSEVDHAVEAMMQRRWPFGWGQVRRVLVVAAAGVLVVACGSSDGAPPAGSGSSGSPSVTSGPLPTFGSYQELEAALAPDCDWQVSPPSGSPDDAGDPYGLFCAELGIRAVWYADAKGDTLLTVEWARGLAARSQDFRCVVMAVYCQMMAIGGNWMAWAADPDRTSDIAISTGAFLLPAPIGSPQPSP